MKPTYAWTILFVAGLFEIAWVVGLKYSNGFLKLWPSVFTIVAMAISIWLLSISIKTIPIGSAYAVWTGIGAIGTVIFGVLLFSESKEFLKVFFISLVIIGIIGLRVVGK